MEEGGVRDGSVGVQVELFLVAPHGHDHVEFMRRTGPVDGDPDEAARFLLDPAKVEVIFLHSTSWRYEASKVMLTYLAFCERAAWDDWPDGHLSLAEVHMHGHGQHSHLHPRPDQISVQHVLAHGLGHLSWMAHRADDNPCLRRLSASALAWLRNLVPLPAGQI